MGALKDFFKPEIKKFVLPVTLVISFFLIVYLFSIIDSLVEKQSSQICENQQTLDMIKTLSPYTNSSDLLTNIGLSDIEAKDLRGLLTSLASRNSPEVLKILGLLDTTVQSYRLMDPLVPVTCILYQEESCRYYVSQETFDCLNEFYVAIQPILGFSDLIPYRQISVADYAMNITFLFIEGYIVSCAMVFVLRKIRGK